MRLLPMDILANGTKVQIGNKRGCVIKHKVVNAIPSGQIVVHTVKLTEKRKTLTANRYTWEACKAETTEVNYTAIWVLEKEKH